jgi:hypothetical protein
MQHRTSQKAVGRGAHSKIPGIEPLLLKRGNLHANHYPPHPL